MGQAHMNISGHLFGNGPPSLLKMTDFPLYAVLALLILAFSCQDRIFCTQLKPLLPEQPAEIVLYKVGENQYKYNFVHCIKPTLSCSSVTHSHQGKSTGATLPSLIQITKAYQNSKTNPCQCDSHSLWFAPCPDQLLEGFGETFPLLKPKFAHTEKRCCK